MSKTAKKSTLSISIDQEIRESLVSLSASLDLTISKLARNLIYTSLDDYKLLSKVGLNRHIYAFRASCKNLSDCNALEGVIGEELGNSALISVVLDSEVKEIMEQYSKKLGIPMKTFARNMIYIGLKDLKLLKKIGILQISKSFDAFLNTYLNFKVKQK